MTGTPKGRGHAAGVIAAALVCVSGAIGKTAAQEPALPDLLRLSGEYVAAYGPRVSGVSVDELFTLIETRNGQMLTPLRLTSDVVLVHANGRILSLRDPFAIDSKALRARDNRIVGLLAEPTLAGWQAAQDYSRAGAKLLLANVVVWFSDPVLALQFAAGPNQKQVTYRLDGKKRINGVQVVGLGFKEQEAQGKKYVLDIPGNPHASGRLWVDPATGAIHQTELSIQSAADTARVVVTYAIDPKMAMLAPSEASHRFESSERTDWDRNGPAPFGEAGGSERRFRCDGRAWYSNLRYAKIDLNHITR